MSAKVKQVTAFSKKDLERLKIAWFYAIISTVGNLLYAGKELLNGRFDFLVLHLLSKEKMYGFQIIKKLFDATDGEIEMKTGTLYPLLQTLENNGYIAASLVLINGRDRNVYQITEKGRIYLSEQKKRWIRYRTIANKILEL